MRDAVAEIRAAQGRALVDEDGSALELVLGPPATAEEVARLEEGAGAPLARELRDDRAFDVWGTGHGALTHEQALAAGGDVAAFARTLPHGDYLVHDLRAASPGEGFARGLAQPDEVLRYGHQRMFAVDRTPSPGLLRRLFRR